MHFKTCEKSICAFLLIQYDIVSIKLKLRQSQTSRLWGNVQREWAMACHLIWCYFVFRFLIWNFPYNIDYCRGSDASNPEKTKLETKRKKIEFIEMNRILKRGLLDRWQLTVAFPCLSWQAESVKKRCCIKTMLNEILPLLTKS